MVSKAADAMVALWRDVTQRRQEALQVRQDAEELRRKLQSAEAKGSGNFFWGKTSGNWYEIVTVITKKGWH